MAMNIVIRGLIQKSIFSYVASGLSDTEIHGKVAGKYPEYTPSERGTIQTIINSTRRGSQAAAELEAGTRGAGDAAGIPIDWSHIGTESRYAYRVLVVSRNNNTGETFDTVVTVYSRSTLDHADIINLVSEQSERDYFTERYPSKLDYLAPSQSTTFQVVGVGRHI